VQRYVDRRRRDFDVYSCLNQLDNEHLLPQQNPNTHYTDQVHSVPIRNFDAHEMGTTMRFRPSTPAFSRTRTNPRPVLGPRPSKSIPIPRLRLQSTNQDSRMESCYPPDRILPRHRWRLKSTNPSLQTSKTGGGEQ
jgi:hypothetical protein